MYTEIEKDEEEVKYNEITIPAKDVDYYLSRGWELVNPADKAFTGGLVKVKKGVIA